MVGGYPIPGLGWGGTPSHGWGWGYPSQVWMVGGTSSLGVPQPGLYGGGIPGVSSTMCAWWGYPGVPPTIKTWFGYPPTLGWGTPQTWNGVPPPSRPGWGTPPPSRSEWGTPNPKPGMGYPPPSRPGRGTSQTWDGVPLPPSRSEPPPQTWDGVPPPPPPTRQSSIANTCYAAGGMSFAFTQEDFLVIYVFIPWYVR